jgi:hypothetical protein
MASLFYKHELDYQLGDKYIRIKRTNIKTKCFGGKECRGTLMSDMKLIITVSLALT